MPVPKEWTQRVFFIFLPPPSLPPPRYASFPPMITPFGENKLGSLLFLFLTYYPRIKSSLLLALIFPSYLVVLFHLNPLVFLFKMKQPPLEVANMRHRRQDFNHLQNIISSVSIHLTSEPIHLCLYMPVPGRETLQLTL